MSDIDMKDRRRTVVTGIGVLTSNGNSREEFFHNCKDGVSGIKECSLFDASKLRTAYVGEVDKKLPFLTEKHSDKERITYLMDDAITECLCDSGLTAQDISQLEDRAYLAFATSLASNGRIMGFIDDKNKGVFEGEWLVRIPGFVSWIKERCGINGGCYTTMSACAAGTTAAGIAFDLISENKADLVVVGGADPLTEFSCMGFHALKSLSGSVCKPFDKKRDGINIGEAGIFFIFETLEHAKSRGAKIYGEVLGYGINNDAYHITSPDPEGRGAFASMSMALKDSGITAKEIDYVNAHGTGTLLNDEMEVNAINRFFKDTDKKVAVSSTKSMVGHCLAAAGVVEIAATLLSIKEKTIMPTINLEEMMDECSIQEFPVEKNEREIKYAISNSFAFAGNTASVLLGKLDDE